MIIRKQLTELVQIWLANPSISRFEMFETGKTLLQKKKDEDLPGIFKIPPKMITATIDDAFGQGLEIIHLFSNIAGVEVIHLGLMQNCEKIINACQKTIPDILGLTILQFDSEEEILALIPHIPNNIQVILGGPIFKSFSPHVLKQKPYLVLNQIGLFLQFLLKFK